MADMGSIPVGFQVHVQKLNQRLTALEQKYDAMKVHWDDMARRVADAEQELKRRKGGRPTHKRSEAA